MSNRPEPACLRPLWSFPLTLKQVIFDVLLRKSDLVEKFVAFANNPRLLQRFRERLAEYERYWEGVQVGFCFKNEVVFGLIKPMGSPAPVVCVAVTADLFTHFFFFFALAPTAAGLFLL